MLFAGLAGQVAVDRGEEGALVERIVSPAHELSAWKSVLVRELVRRSEVRASGLQLPAHIIEQGGVMFPLADETLEVAENPRRHSVNHDDVHVGLAEGREIGEERIVVAVGYRDIGDLREHMNSCLSVGHFRIRQTAEETGNLGAVLVVDEGADDERLAPKAVSAYGEAKYLFHNFLLS